MNPTTEAISELKGTQYWHADEPKRLSREIIETNHPQLLGHRLDFVFCNRVQRVNGRDALATASLQTGLLSIYAEAHEVPEEPTCEKPFFLMRVWAIGWGYLDEKQKNALVDHELCHMKVNDEDEPYLVGHDVEEFSAVIERHGLWTDNLVKMALAMHEVHLSGQPPLEDMEPESNVIDMEAAKKMLEKGEQPPKKKPGRKKKDAEDGE